MLKIVLYGAGKLGKQMHYIVDKYFHDTIKIVGFADDTIEKGTLILNSLHNLGSIIELNSSKNYSPENTKLVLSIGYSNMNGRKIAFTKAKEFGYSFENIIHPKAFVEKNVAIGEGVIILPGVVVDQYVTINDINYLDIGTIIGEETIIGSNNYFSAGSTIAGSVNIGENNFFGLNTTIVNGLTLGNNNFVNAQSLIYKNIGNNKKIATYPEQRIIEIIS